jgi:hypothetical protein
MGRHLSPFSSKSLAASHFLTTFLAFIIQNQKRFILILTIPSVQRKHERVPDAALLARCASSKSVSC